MADTSSFRPRPQPLPQPQPRTSATLQAHLNVDDQQKVNENQRNLCTAATIRQHNKNILKLVNFLEEKVRENPAFINGSITELVVDVDLDGVEDKAAYSLATSGGADTQWRTKDLVWNNLAKNMVELYYTDERYNCKWKKALPNAPKELQRNKDGLPIMLGFDTRRKVFDAILYGQKTAGQYLNDELLGAKPAILKSLSVADAEGKSKGQVEEKEADAIPFALFEFMCYCAILSGNAFWWVMALLQWNCMAGSQNIDNLRFRNFSMGLDSLVVKFGQTKMDKSGKKTSPKNCYANPFNFYVCLFTALAVYFCTLNDKWTADREYIFINPGSKPGSASSSYCDSIRKWAVAQKNRIMEFIRLDHTNAHGIRKGSATEAMANTAETSLPSVFHRGEWSLGVVLDIYWKFAQRGDQLLGRILAGLDPDSADFDVLPPHFTVSMDDERIQKAMKLCFGNILDSERNRCDNAENDGNGNSFMPAILLRCLASLVYHEDSIRKVIASRPAHPWKNLAIFSDQQLLKELKSLVTTDPTPGICDKATGTARHTKMMKAVNKILQSFRQDKAERQLAQEEQKTRLQKSRMR